MRLACLRVRFAILASVLAFVDVVNNHTRPAVAAAGREAGAPGEKEGGADWKRCRSIQTTTFRRSWLEVSEEDRSWWYTTDCEAILRGGEGSPYEPGATSLCPGNRDAADEESQALQSLQDLYKNETCVLLANGPSLNSIRWDWQETFSGPIMGMNKIFLAQQRFSLRPDLYAATNPLVVSQSREQIWDWVPTETLKWVIAQARHEFPCRALQRRNIMFFKGLLSGQEPQFSLDISYMNRGWTVTYICLQVLYYVGCSKVIILGMDHHFEQRGKPGESQNMTGPDPNHFDPNYFANQTWQLAGLEKSESSYRIARRMFEADGRSIIDATVGGKCTVFEKGDYEEILYSRHGHTHMS